MRCRHHSFLSGARLRFARNTPLSVHVPNACARARTASYETRCWLHKKSVCACVTFLFSFIFPGHRTNFLTLYLCVCLWYCFVSHSFQCSTKLRARVLFVSCQRNTEPSACKCKVQFLTKNFSNFVLHTFVYALSFKWVDPWHTKPLGLYFRVHHSVMSP